MSMAYKEFFKGRKKNCKTLQNLLYVIKKYSSKRVLTLGYQGQGWKLFGSEPKNPKTKSNRNRFQTEPYSNSVFGLV